MTIEFNCPNCSKLLRTRDDKAGAQAKCPDCGSPIQVPAAGGPPAEAEEEFGYEEQFDYGEEDYEDYGEDFAAAAPPPRAGKTKPCPMCGERIKADAVKCRYCGEDLGLQPGGPRRPTKVDSGDVITTSWEIYKSNFGICFGGVLLAFVINFGASIPQSVLQAMIDNNVGGRDGAVMLVLLYLAAIVFSWIVQIFMTLGQAILLLNVARGRRAEIGDLFKGGPYFWRMLGNSIVFGVAVILGFLACIIPGIIVSLMFWPYVYVLVDRDEHGLGPLTKAKELTEGNWLAVFVLWLASFGIMLLGLLMLCIGALFTAPLVSLFGPVAYCRMAGIRTVRV